MVELASHHKIGLNLRNPVMIAAGCGGYGQAYQGLIDLSHFGALVTHPITLRPERGRPQPRVVETNAGFLMDTGQQNPGIRKVIQQNRKIWGRLDLPIIPHLPAMEPDDLMRTARALSGIQTARGYPLISAIELGLPFDASVVDINICLEALHEGSELPILAKIPLGASPKIAEAAVQGQADCLVIGAPPLASALDTRTQQIVNGYLYSPALHSLVIQDIARLTYLDLPLVAVGGIHTMTDVEAFLMAGAAAVQLDSLLFIEPKEAEAIARAYSEKIPENQGT